MNNCENNQETAHEENRLYQGIYLILGAVVADDDKKYGCITEEAKERLPGCIRVETNGMKSVGRAVT